MNIAYSLFLFMSLFFTTNISNPGYDIGDVATDFKLENIDGKFVSHICLYCDFIAFPLTRPNFWHFLIAMAI